MLCNEFDPEKRAIINPEDVIKPMPGFPEIYAGVFSDSIVNHILAKFDHEVLTELESVAGNCPVYRVKAYGVEVAFSLARVGGPAAVGNIEEIFPLGAKYFVFAGSCGVLQKEIARNHLIVPTAAVRDEGVSYHYLSPADEVSLDPQAVKSCCEALDALGLPYVRGKAWTTDAFYRETRKKMERRKEQGCICVEMECASLAAVAQFRGLPFAQILWGGDNLDAPEWDRRGLSDRGSSIGDMVFAAMVETGRRMQREA